MGHISRYFILFAKLLFLFLSEVKSETFSVKIGTEEHINIVDSRFLSFTVDPKYLFSSTEKYNSNESICMATALTPAYIRIAGPSTANMVFQNTTITFTDLSNNTVKNLDKDQTDEIHELSVTYFQWQKFVQWTKKTGFDLVFALSNEERTESGLWEPSSALDILTVADRAGVSDIFWQLGYECKNQSIDDYLSDLETLRVIIETVSADEARGWRAVGSDVSGCLREDSKSDFGDYVTLTDEMMDAVLLNGKSSARELERLSEAERLKLLKRLSTSSTPLWLTEAATPRTPQHPHLQLHRAADWMTSLGFSARNGFAVNFRELVEEELFEPTLSFYMALLYKNLVGDRVLDVAMDSEGSEVELFAHCTSLRHKPVAGAVTLYGVNMGASPARLSVKLSKREEGGDIMQFILALDVNGNIAVNGRAMYHEGDIRPVVKRVRPYKSLLISLPPKSIGFWVLANTNIQACHDFDDDAITELVEAEDVTNATEVNNVKKRSVDYDINDNVADDFANDHDEKVVQNLKKRLLEFDEDIENVHSLFEKKRKNKMHRNLRTERDVISEENETVKDKSKRHNTKNKNSENKPKLELLKRFFGLSSRANDKSRKSRSCKVCKNFRNIKNKIISKRHSKQAKVKSIENNNEEINEHKKFRRHRRSVVEEKRDVRKIKDDISSENEVDFDEKDQIKLWKILRNIHEQLKDLPADDNDDNENTEYVDKDDFKDDEQIIVKNKMSDGRTTVNYLDKSKQGLLKSTVSNVVNVLSDLNTNLNRFWNAISLLD